MLISVSQIKRHIECPMLAHYEYALLRGPARKADALELGSLVHLALEAILKGEMWEAKVEEALSEQEPIRSVELSELFDALRPAIQIWRPQDDWRIVGTEVALELPLGEHTLVGRLDSVVEWNGSFWHLQHKTLGASVPVATYCEQQRTDWHESVYHRMAERAGYVPFSGTILNIIRKLSSKAMTANAAAAIVPPQYLPRTNEEVDNALADLAVIIDDIEQQKTGQRRIIKNRTACAGAYRNSLCAYKPVCDGDTTIDSPEYVDLKNRYEDNGP